MIRPAVDERQAKKARPRYGTEHGDASMGNCSHAECGVKILRADSFVVTLAGGIFHTACWGKLTFPSLAVTRPSP